MTTNTLQEIARMDITRTLAKGALIEMTNAQPFLRVLPFLSIEGNAIGYYRKAGTDVYKQCVSVLQPIHTDTPAGPPDYDLPHAIGSQYRQLACLFMEQLVDATGPWFNGLASLAHPTQIIRKKRLKLKSEVLGELLGLVKGSDFILMSEDMLKSVRNTCARDARLHMADGIGQLWTFQDVIIFPFPTTSKNASSIFAGRLDDGSRLRGLAVCHSPVEAGLVLDKLNEGVYRSKWYVSPALFAEDALAAVTNVRAV